MRTKEELEVVVLALHERINCCNTNFKRGLLYGAMDALAWAMDEKHVITNSFATFAAKELKHLKPKRRPKKRAVGADHFGM